MGDVEIAVGFAGVRLLALALAISIAVPTLSPVRPSLAAGTLDQSQTNQSGAGGSSPGLAYVQTFTAGLSGNLDQVNVTAVVGTPATLMVQIRDVVVGVPGTDVLASAEVPLASTPVCCLLPLPFVSVPLNPPVPVVAGSQYAIIWSTSVTLSASADGTVTVPGSYVAGEAGAINLSSGAYTSLDPLDYAFQTFVTQAVLSVAGGQVVEGNGGAATLVFPVYRTLVLPVDATVPYTLADGTATGGPACAPGVDFINTGGVATIAAGNVVGAISVPVCGDADFEADETLAVTLGAPTHAVPGSTQALGAIRDDEATPTPTATATLTPTATLTVTPTPPVLPSGGNTTPTPTLRPASAPEPVRVSVQRAGSGRLLVTIAADQPIRQVVWTPQPNVAVETVDGDTIPGGVLTLPGGSLTAVFQIRKLSGAGATVPLTVTGGFGEWRTFVGGGPAAW